MLRFEQVMKMDCPECGGSGEVWSHNSRCCDCNGTGQIPLDMDAFLIANGWKKQLNGKWRNLLVCAWDCDWSQALYFERSRAIT